MSAGLSKQTKRNDLYLSDAIPDIEELENKVSPSAIAKTFMIFNITKHDFISFSAKLLMMKHINVAERSYRRRFAFVSHAAKYNPMKSSSQNVRPTIHCN